ncbi:MAG: hypothetical protein ACI841_003161 [Planctomycetota bacterium]|jgi:hypothetical protein
MRYKVSREVRTSVWHGMTDGLAAVGATNCPALGELFRSGWALRQGLT